MLIVVKKYLILTSIAIFSVTAARSQETSRNVEIIPVRSPCATSETCKTANAIIFVHGLFGSTESWLNETSGKSWPEMIASDAQLKHTDVFKVKFTSFMFSESPTASKISDDLFSTMLDIYNSGYKKIMFVGHSFGGNLIRSHIVALKSRWGHRALNNIRLVILMGSPTEGAPLAGTGSFLLPNPQTRTLVPLERNDYLSLLNSTFVRANAKHKDFGCPSLRTFAGYEKLKTFGRMIVSQTSATAGAFACKGFEKDHIDLAKPEDISDDVYKSVLRLLVLCTLDDDRVCPRPPIPRRIDYWCGAREYRRLDTAGGFAMYDTTRESSPCVSQWP